MPIFSKLIFYAVRWSARHGLHEADNQKNSVSPQDKLEKKEKARRTGTRGETYGYWYLRRLSYVFVAKNYMPAGAKGELDLVGYDGETLAFVEIRTRTIQDDSAALPALPELSVTHSKQAVLVRTAQRFLSDRHLRDCHTRSDILAIDNIPGQSPVVRLHKDAFSPQLHR
jgi:putative endonuclease